MTCGEAVMKLLAAYEVDTVDISILCRLFQH